MMNGETRKIGSATIVCTVHRMSWTKREDRWMGAVKPRYTNSRTVYRVIGADGRQVAVGIEGYANAVKIAKGL